MLESGWAPTPTLSTSFYLLSGIGDIDKVLRTKAKEHKDFQDRSVIIYETSLPYFKKEK